MQFEQLLKSAQTSVLAQVGRFAAVKKFLTASAASLVAAAMLTTTVTPQDAHAGDLTFERIAKDALGGAAGAALFGQFGKGRGRDAMRVIGAVAGVAVAESLQQPKPQQNYTFSMSPSQGFSFQQNNPGMNPGMNTPSASFNGAYAGLSSGTEQMAPDKRDKLIIHERNALQARDTYARALYTLQQAEENQVLNPRNKVAQQELSNANTSVQSALQQYAVARSDFMNACEFMGRRGYDMQEFSHSYTLLQATVTARDMNPKDLARVEVQQQPSAQLNF